MNELSTFPMLGKYVQSGAMFQHGITTASPLYLVGIDIVDTYGDEVEQRLCHPPLLK